MFKRNNHKKAVPYIYQILYYVLFYVPIIFQFYQCQGFFLFGCMRVLSDGLFSIVICKMNKCQLESELSFFYIPIYLYISNLVPMVICIYDLLGIMDYNFKIR